MRWSNLQGQYAGGARTATTGGTADPHGWTQTQQPTQMGRLLCYPGVPALLLARREQSPP